MIVESWATNDGLTLPYLQEILLELEILEMETVSHSTLHLLDLVQSLAKSVF